MTVSIDGYGVLTDEQRARLRERFKPEEHDTFQGKGGRTYSYIDARNIFDRLDEVVGPENWSDDWELIDVRTNAVKYTMTVMGMSKSDVGYPNNPMGSLDRQGQPLESSEPLKEAITDGVRRTAIHWGIGRYLYQHFDLKKYTAEYSRVQREPIPADSSQTSQERIAAPSTGIPSQRIPAQTTSDQISADQVEGEGKPASRNQVSTIAKLRKLLDMKDPDDVKDMTAVKAGELITELSRKYNEQQRAARQ